MHLGDLGSAFVIGNELAPRAERLLGSWRARMALFKNKFRKFTGPQPLIILALVELSS